ncbi:FAD-dependent monooxygenase [Streptomyces sp. NPDC060031]|uniref:FAD-dependent monooxygenase n=1 Tax=Streptomyces sp. NPDC060031 TaxID=3347043 RepID=UPI00369CEEDD
MTSRTVLISGAGIAGQTLAHWLSRHGLRPTVVERAGTQRSSGSPVDVRGRAVEVAERMGIMLKLREASTDVTDLRFVNASGKRVGRVNVRAVRRASGSREVEIPRGDLAAILHEASRDHAEFLYGDSIATLSQDEHGVDVTFTHAAPRRFDLVIGADGLHSQVRRLAFGPESGFVRHMGMYVATTSLDTPADNQRDVVLHNTPGRLVSVHPSRGRALAFFVFRSPAVPGFDHRDSSQHKRLLTEAFAGGGWQVPELLGRVRAADDLFFDSVSQVRLDHWSHGRVALLGDAASCVSLFGDGSTLAMAGADTLAAALAATPGDHRSAFRHYEAAHRELVGPKQRGIGRAAALIVPATRPGILARDLGSRLWPLAAAGGWLGQRLPGAGNATGREIVHARSTSPTT